MKDNNIIINEKDRVYIFKVDLVLAGETMECMRNQLKEQIEEGCVVLPPYVKLLTMPTKKRGRKRCKN